MLHSEKLFPEYQNKCRILKFYPRSWVCVHGAYNVHTYRCKRVPMHCANNTDTLDVEQYFFPTSNTFRVVYFSMNCAVHFVNNDFPCLFIDSHNLHVFGFIWLPIISSSSCLTSQICDERQRIVSCRTVLITKLAWKNEFEIGREYNSRRFRYHHIWIWLE